jgi:hypothetical protein
MRREVKVSKVAQSLTVFLLIREKEKLMMRGGRERMMLLQRLFASLVARKAIRVMLVLRMRNDVSVVARKDIRLQSVNMRMLCALIAMKRVILGLNA